MREPTQPIAWANVLSQAWGPNFPVQVAPMALEYSKRFTDSIKKVEKAPVDHFEGALFPLKKSGQWAILYNPNIRSDGRINFTLGHEFGHYLLHRAVSPSGFECGEARVLGFDKDQARRVIEQQADTFASYLLMPMNDYRVQVGRSDMTLDLLNHCADRYGVSRTAAALKWLDFTSETAVLVVARDGFVLWAWRSKAAKKKRIFYGRGTELPALSAAARPGLILDDPNRGMMLDSGVWGTSMDAREMAIFADHYDMTISLIVFDDNSAGYADWEEEPEDTVDRFNRRVA